MMQCFRFVTIVAAFAVAAASALAQTFNVTSPTEGSFIGLSNTVRFGVTGATSEHTIRVTATGPGGVQFTNDGRFNPDADGKINGTLNLNFNQGVPEGAYQVVVTATQLGVTYSTVTINTTLDVTKPKFLQFNPFSGSFVRGIVPIRVDVLEPNFKDYRVQVDSQDIPNNTGTTLVGGAFTVNWDTTGIEFDGAKTVNIRLRDQADNEDTVTFDVTVDRIKPNVSIVQPRSTVKLAPRSNVSIAIDITDANAGSTDITGVDVVARKMDGSFIGRASASSFRQQSGPTNRWTGRLRYRSGLPKQFKLVVNVVDRAGNVANPQEVVVNYR